MNHVTISEHYAYHSQHKMLSMMSAEMSDNIQQQKFIVMYVLHWSDT
jgi:hypothetical protein